MARPSVGPPARAVVAGLRDETIGGFILLCAAALALIWANSPWADAYFALCNTVVGPAALHLNLTLSEWAADGMLAVFFFVAGLELKHELVRGSLRKASTAVVPVAAAIGGMAVPALIYAFVNLKTAGGQLQGWGIPMATDIAFALAVLAVAGRNLPVEVRIFLLTLAVVDDLGSISVIAVFYSENVSLTLLLVAGALLALYAWLQHLRVRSWFIYLPLAFVIWGVVHASGVHATVAGIALGLLTRAHLDDDEEESPVERLNHRIHPFSAGICVPLFAFFAAGVALGGVGIGELFDNPVSVGILLGLVVGKPIGVFGAAWLVTRLRKFDLAPTLRWRDILAVGMVAGVGFTVSLLVAELAFTDESTLLLDAKLAILAASIISAALASVALVRRGRHHSQLSG